MALNSKSIPNESQSSALLSDTDETQFADNIYQLNHRDKHFQSQNTITDSFGRNLPLSTQWGNSQSVNYNSNTIACETFCDDENNARIDNHILNNDSNLNDNTIKSNYLSDKHVRNDDMFQYKSNHLNLSDNSSVKIDNTRDSTQMAMIKENSKLKEEINTLREEMTTLKMTKDENERLKDENELLKEENKELREQNELFKNTLTDAIGVVKESNLLLLKFKAEHCTAMIETYKTQLRNISIALNDQCIRFSKNETFVMTLSSLTAMAADASRSVKQLKVRFDNRFKEIHDALNADPYANIEWPQIDTDSLAPLPDMHKFFKMIMETIPSVFYDDFGVFKVLASDAFWGTNVHPQMTHKNLHVNSKPDSNEPLSIASLPAEDKEKPFYYMKQPKTSPFVETIDISNDVTSALSSNATVTAPKSHTIAKSLNNDTFARNDVFSSTFKESVNCTEIKRVPIDESLSVIIPPLTNVTSGMSSRDSSGAIQESKTESHQMLLIRKLKSLFPQLSDDDIKEYISKTKIHMTINEGRKGFSGMRFGEIINRISTFINGKINMNDPKDLNVERVSKDDHENFIKEQSYPKKASHEPIVYVGITKCPICLESIKHDEYTADCKHKFHSMCLRKWLLKDHSCPVCRSLVLTRDEYPPLGMGSQKAF